MRWLPGTALGPDVERAIALVRAEDQTQVRQGTLVYARWPQSDAVLPALVDCSGDGRFVTLRVFAAHLTEVQRLAEQLTEAMLRERAFDFRPGLRVVLAISAHGVRTDLTSGRVQARRGNALIGLYEANKSALNTTLAVLLITLMGFVLVMPDSNFTPLGKFYGLMGRILSAVLLNALLPGSQFLFFARQREVIDWERP
ncbi:hypothetical protein [Deinococcus alpinitundrae]|uniref:hypothetical protein n=1 Tax=Deinococcus alpinitundrae TaxID=468913 RepID=UPI00137A629A|nr:hypothetical protein [Deinococcus alpinitundrae]